MISVILSRIIIMVFGTLYPAYASFKAVRTKNVKEYVKWMMYWIVFALFTCIEVFADMFLAFWLPFYYEIKILFILWLLSPATKGASILYRKFVHPHLVKREQDIDTYIAKASDKGYSAILELGSKGLSYATNVVITTAMRGQRNLADQIRRSYSLSDIADDRVDGGIRFVSDYDSEGEEDNRRIEEDLARRPSERGDHIEKGTRDQKSKKRTRKIHEYSQDDSTHLTRSKSLRSRQPIHDSSNEEL